MAKLETAQLTEEMAREKLNGARHSLNAVRSFDHKALNDLVEKIVIHNALDTITVAEIKKALKGATEDDKRSFWYQYLDTITAIRPDLHNILERNRVIL